MLKNINVRNYRRARPVCCTVIGLALIRRQEVEPA